MRGDRVEQIAIQIAQYFLWSVMINAVTLLIIVGVLAYALIQIRRDTREIIQQVSNVGAMTQNVAAMTREILRRTE
jgi:hypothetical protein